MCIGLLRGRHAQRAPIPPRWANGNACPRPRSATAPRLRTLLDAAPPLDPLAREGQELLLGWDLATDPENRSAALAILTLRPVHDNRPPTVAPDELVRRLEQAAHGALIRPRARYTGPPPGG